MLGDSVAHITQVMSVVWGHVRQSADGPPVPAALDALHA
jgi:hypothetical protein